MKNYVIKKRRSFISFVLSVLIVMMSVGAVLPIAAVSEDPSAAPASNEPVEFTLAQLQELQVPDSDIPSLMTRAQIEEKGHAVRLKAEEPNKNTVIFQNRDGSKTAYFYNTPVKYTDENGIVRDKSSAITAYSGMYDGKSYAYAMTDNDVKVYFSRIGTEGVKLASGGYDIEMVPMNTGSLMIPSVSFENNDTVRYNNMYGLGTAIEYKTLLNGVKEDIVLSNYTGQNSFNFMLYTDGLALVENGGDFYLADNTGARVASIGKVIANDSGNKTVYGTMNYNTVKAGAQYMINISVDTAFLTASDTVYPVRIDPTVTIDQGESGNALYNRIQDTALYKSDAYVVGLQDNIHSVGYYSSEAYAGRMAIRFPMFIDPIAEGMSSSYSYLRDVIGSRVYSATLSLYAADVENGTNIYVSPMTSAPSYSSSGIEYNTSIFNSYTTNDRSSAYVGSTGRKYFDVTSIVKDWVDYPSSGYNPNGLYSPSNGLMIMNNDETDGLKAVKFYSSMYYDPNYQPTLSVTYGTTAYYINNVATGEFLRISGSSLDSSICSGYPGTAYKWYLDLVGTNTYVIRDVEDYSKVLYFNGSSVSVSTVSVTTQSYSLGSNYRWTLESNSGKWEIRSAANNSKILGLSGGSIVAYEAPIGFVPNGCDWYIESEDDYVPLNNISIWINGVDATLNNDDIYLTNIGDSLDFTMTFNPSSADFVDWEDFEIEAPESMVTVTEGRIVRIASGTSNNIPIIFTHRATDTTVSINIWAN